MSWIDPSVSAAPATGGATTVTASMASTQDSRADMSRERNGMRLWGIGSLGES